MDIDKYMEHLYQQRRERMRELIDAKFEGRQTDLARRIKKQQDYISRCLSGGKKIGETLAREIELEIGITPGWMDGSLPLIQAAGNLSDDEKLVLDLLRALPKDERKGVSFYLQARAAFAAGEQIVAPKHLERVV